MGRSTAGGRRPPLAMLATVAVVGLLFLALRGAHDKPRRRQPFSSSSHSRALPLRALSLRLDSQAASAHASASAADMRHPLGPMDRLAVLHIPKAGGTRFGLQLLSIEPRSQLQLPCWTWRGETLQERLRQTNPASEHDLAAAGLGVTSFRCPLRLSGTASGPVNQTELARRLWQAPAESAPVVGGQWLLSRFTVGWPCGKHPSLPRLQRCLQQLLSEGLEASSSSASSSSSSSSMRTVRTITVLREPTDRFLSEFVQSYDGWGGWHDGLDAQRLQRQLGLLPGDHFCNGTLRPPPPACSAYRPRAYDRQHLRAALGRPLDHAAGNDSGAEAPPPQSLANYLLCPYNPALNRQTRMLAAGLGCVPNGRDGPDEAEMLAAAVDALMHGLVFFGLAEYPRRSRQLLEYTLGVRVQVPDPLPSPAQSGGAGGGGGSSVSAAAHVRRQLHPHELRLIAAANRLDEELYAAALAEFKRRLAACPVCDPL